MVLRPSTVVLGAERPMVKVFSTRGYSSGEGGTAGGTFPPSGGMAGALAGLEREEVGGGGLLYSLILMP